ncbi:precorrin-2 dehydrogenase/sirohydrochlorin ferrochelatase family protein [Paenibacillus physcomitrellae]|uniref:precorrin-2 dehydrogenase n=1 Tax=Paenibacillus physcomitrellae TaxID=1619311 RepID=A0ABQ1G5E9_9BACL|nr:NAD(P)-dependent oxidoreductase [Paenibacillus physcomitrellae]GGA36450.1 siroheme synthase [Paenibacillus physcomitrellae]
MAHYIPIMLDCEGLKGVIIGGGRIAARKAAPLLEGGAELTVISPALGSELEQKRQAGPGQITWINRLYEAGDLKGSGAAIVYACTPDPIVNRNVAEEARELHIPVNVATRSSDGSFITPTVIRRGDLVLSVSASGASPVLVRSITNELNERFGEEYALYLEFWRTVRERVKRQVADPARRVYLLNKLGELDIWEQIRAGEFRVWSEGQIDEWIVKG